MPLEEALLQSIGTMLLSVEGVVEAHLPECFAMDIMERPAQVLVVVIESTASSEDVVDEVLLGLATVLPEDTQLGVWSMDAQHSLLATVQATKSRLM